jgi:hypothetical protein
MDNYPVKIDDNRTFDCVVVLYYYDTSLTLGVYMYFVC